MSLHMLVWKELFRIDKGSPGGALHICSCMFITIAVVVINYIYSERYYFSLFHDTMMILILLKLWT